MNGKQEIYKRLKEDFSLTNGQAKTFVDAVFGYMADIICELPVGEEVSFSRFGSAKKVVKPEHAGHNPRTGEVVTVPEREVVRFKIAKGLKFCG